MQINKFQRRCNSHQFGLPALWLAGGFLLWLGLAAAHGQPIRELAAVPQPDGKIQLFVLRDGMDNQGFLYSTVYRVRQLGANGTWPPAWDNTVNSSVSSFSVGERSNGSLEVFTNVNGAIDYLQQSGPNSAQWAGNFTLGGAGVGQTAVGSNADGRVELFVIGGNGAIYHIWELSPNGDWGGWSSLGGFDLQALAVGRNADGRLQVFAIGGNHVAYMMYQTTQDGGWSDWRTLGGVNLTDLAVGTNADGRLEVFALDMNGAVQHTSQAVPNGDWYDFSPLDGNALQQIAVGANQDGRLELFALGGDGAVYHTWQTSPSDDQNWSGWQSLGGSAVQRIAVANELDGRLEVFAAGGDNAIYSRTQALPNGWWHDWVFIAPDPFLPPKPVPPSAPTNVQAFAGDGQATVTWNAPASNGGSSIVAYAVDVYPANSNVALFEVNAIPGNVLMWNMKPLTNGQSYYFKVRAGNKVGDSPNSGPSNVVTPVAQQQQGIGTLRFFNCTDDRHDLHVWLNDQTAGSGWNEQGTISQQWDQNGNCPFFGAQPLAVDFTTGHAYAIEVLEPDHDGCGGMNDPMGGFDCIRFSGSLPGLTGGPVVEQVVN